jgi:hypothetical protein
MGMYGGDAQARRFAINIGEQRRREAQRDKNWNREMDVQQSRYEDQSARDLQRMAIQQNQFGQELGLRKSALDINQQDAARNQQEYEYQQKQRDLSQRMTPWAKQGTGYIVKGVLEGKPMDKILEEFNSMGNTSIKDAKDFKAYQDETGNIVIEKKGKKQAFTPDEYSRILDLHEQEVDNALTGKMKKAQVENIESQVPRREAIAIQKEIEKEQKRLDGYEKRMEAIKLKKIEPEQQGVADEAIKNLKTKIIESQNRIKALSGTPEQAETKKGGDKWADFEE